jgi:hypothetical protein
MLPPTVESLIRTSIDVYLKAQGYRPPRFGQRLLAQSFGGDTIQPAKVAAVSANEIKAVSSGLVTAIKNVIQRSRINPSEDIENGLLHVFDSEFDKCADAIRKFGGDIFKGLRANDSTPDWLHKRLEDARQAGHLELKLLAAEVLNYGPQSIKSPSTSDPTKSPGMRARIFISHSSTDRELAALLVDLLRSSLNLPAESIRCTSVDGHGLAGGAATDSALRTDIRDCEAFIGLISATSIDSAYVLFELGARWGAERHLLPLLAPTADAAILRGPLLGLNALRCSSAANLQQMIDEIARVLKISADKPATYQRHIERILSRGTVERPRSEPHIPLSPEKPHLQKVVMEGDEYQGAEAIIEKHCEEKWRDDYSMREYCIDEEEQALAELKSGRPDDIPEEVFRRIREKAAAKWPSEFSMRLYTEQEEFKSYRKLQTRRR